MTELGRAVDTELAKIWSTGTDGYFLDTLLPKFWRLTLQMAMRYMNYQHTVTESLLMLVDHHLVAEAFVRLFD